MKSVILDVRFAPESYQVTSKKVKPSLPVEINHPQKYNHRKETKHNGHLLSNRLRGFHWHHLRPLYAEKVHEHQDYQP